MDIGLHIAKFNWPGSPDSIGPALARVAATADEAGFSMLSVMDHLWQLDWNGEPEEEMLEAYTTLGFLAGRTSRITLLAWVTAVTYREPGLLAKAVTTLDVISGGRAVLGVGAGWDVAEHEAYGIGFPGLGERFSRLDEELAICDAMFREERVTFAGTFYTMRDAYNSPRPVRGSIPVLVAGGGEKRTLDLVARYADACNVFAGEPADVRHKFDVLEVHCERIGRDPAEITRTVFAFDTSDLAALAVSARSLADVGADGMIIVGPEDPARIPEIGRVLAEVFPG